MVPARPRALEDADRRPRTLRPHRLGSRIFLTTAIEGEVIPGHTAVKHTDDGQPFLHPDSVGVERRNTLKVMALDAATGTIAWEQTAYDGALFDNRHRRSSYASATPVTDGERVYAYFGPEGVYAYRLDGQLAWKTSVGKIKTLGLGIGASPVLFRDVLILQCDDDDPRPDDLLRRCR